MTRIAINTYRLRKLAMGMTIFTIADLVAGAGVTAQTAYDFVGKLRVTNTDFLLEEELKPIGPGRRIKRYTLTRLGYEHLAEENAPVAREINEEARTDPALAGPETSRREDSTSRIASISGLSEGLETPTLHQNDAGSPVVRLEEMENTTQLREALLVVLTKIGDRPLYHQEEGCALDPSELALIDDLDHLAYLGRGRVAVLNLAEPDPKSYLNGLLLAAVAHLARQDTWTAFARLELFLFIASQLHGVVEPLRIAQAYSFRALAGYQVLDLQHKELSWLRIGKRKDLDQVSSQAFEDVHRAASTDPNWKHATFVEALLCSRLHLSEGREDNSDMQVSWLRRAVALHKELIDERAYRGPSRRQLIRCLKRIAELTGEKSDFSDFGYALNTFPSDEELADEALAARQPNSQDRFLWQWLIGDEEVFGEVRRLNQAEYRAFWIRMLDNKVNIRSWRDDLLELQRRRPVMKDWSIQLLTDESSRSISDTIWQRRYESSA